MKNPVILFALSFFALVSCQQTSHLIDFNDETIIEIIPPSPGTPYSAILGDPIPVGSSIVVTTTYDTIDVRAFKWGGGTKTGEGYVRIVTSQEAGGNGNEVHFMNATLWVRNKSDFDVEKIKFKYADLGGNINMVLDNFNWHYPDNFQNIPTPTPNGVNIIVNQVNNKGTIELKNGLGTFKYHPPPTVEELGFNVGINYIAAAGGGQELWIDDLKFVGK